jgi:hypothetical protein
MIPSVGRIVRYTLSADDATQSNKRKADAYNNRYAIRDESKGYVTHSGNGVSAGDVYPMIIVRVWGDSDLVNGQVFLDGNDTLWVTSIKQGPGVREWHEPPRT